MMSLEEPNPKHEWILLIILIVGAILFFILLPHIGPIKVTSPNK